MNRLVRLIGKKLSGSLVVNSTVMSSILRAEAKVGMRDAVTPTWLGSNCGASCFKTFSTFHTTASALNGVPSVNFTPWRRVIVIDLPPLENLYPVARSGMIFPFGPSSNSSPKMASIWLWSAAPLMFVAGSRPAGQSPENPVHSSTVSVPPAFGVPLLACIVVLDVLLPPQAARRGRSARKANVRI